jgi:hypothetical protein
MLILSFNIFQSYSRISVKKRPLSSYARLKPPKTEDGMKGRDERTGACCEKRLETRIERKFVENPQKYANT